MQISGEHLELLQAVRAEWDKAEQDVKTAELVCSKVVFPAIKELRYAGRRIVDALRCIESGDAAEAKDFLCDARFDCMRARHDAIDVAAAKMAIDLDIMVQKLGYEAILPTCPDFPQLVAHLNRARMKIAASRGNRQNREEIYAAIESADFPDLVKKFMEMKESEDVMRSLAKKSRINTFLGWAGAILGLLGLGSAFVTTIWGDDIKAYILGHKAAQIPVYSEQQRATVPIFVRFPNFSQ